MNPLKNIKNQVKFPLSKLLNVYGIGIKQNAIDMKQFPRMIQLNILYEQIDEGDNRNLLDMYFEFSDYVLLNTTNVSIMTSQ